MEILIQEKEPLPVKLRIFNKCHVLVNTCSYMYKGPVLKMIHSCMHTQLGDPDQHSCAAAQSEQNVLTFRLRNRVIFQIRNMPNREYPMKTGRITVACLGMRCSHITPSVPHYHLTDRMKYEKSY